MRGKASESGPDFGAKFRVAPVSRPLICVAEMVDKGMKVVFGADDNGHDTSHMEIKATGDSLALEPVSNIYELPLHVEEDVIHLRMID